MTNTGARTKANLHSSVCFFCRLPSLIKTSSSCGLSQLLDVLVEQLLEISSGSCSSVCQLVLGIGMLGWGPVGGWVPHRACPTQHFCVGQTASVEVRHRCCVGFLDSLLRWEGQGNVSFLDGGVGRFRFLGRRGFFFVFDNFLGRWGRSRVGLLGYGSLVVGCFDDLLNLSLHLGVRSTSVKQKNKSFFSISPNFFVGKNNLFPPSPPFFFPTPPG